jgi:hypothetical protein
LTIPEKSGIIKKMMKVRTKIRRGKDRKMNNPTNLHKFNGDHPSTSIVGRGGITVVSNLKELENLRMEANKPYHPLENLKKETEAPIIPHTLASVTAAPAPTFWETDIQVIKSCGVIGEAIPVSISSKARNKINVLMKHFPGTEWLAYLVGNKDLHYVDDIAIPKQRVSSVRVDVDGDVGIPIIGVIHSHHDMGNGFSHTDDTFINQNHDISLCISHKGINGHVRVKTECGRFALVPANVSDFITEFVTDDFLKEVDTLITKQTYSYPAGNYGNYTRSGNTFQRDIDAYGLEEEVDFNRYNRSLRVQHHILDEVVSYEQSIRGTVVDAYYTVEFEMLAGLIESIGSVSYDMWEDRAFNGSDNVYTEDYYRIVDEISTFSDELTEAEKVALNKLALCLRKRLETNA